MPPGISVLSLHDALPICCLRGAYSPSLGGSRLYPPRRKTCARGDVPHDLPVRGYESSPSRVNSSRDGAWPGRAAPGSQNWEARSEEHTSELQSLRHLVCRPGSPSFPYTTLFRSVACAERTVRHSGGAACTRRGAKHAPAATYRMISQFAGTSRRLAG